MDQEICLHGQTHLSLSRLVVDGFLWGARPRRRPLRCFFLFFFVFLYKCGKVTVVGFLKKISPLFIFFFSHFYFLFLSKSVKVTLVLTVIEKFSKSGKVTLVGQTAGVTVTLLRYNKRVIVTPAVCLSWG